MSNVLIVHAHPEPASLTSALKDLAVEKLRADGKLIRGVPHIHEDLDAARRDI